MKISVDGTKGTESLCRPRTLSPYPLHLHQNIGAYFMHPSPGALNLMEVWIAHAKKIMFMKVNEWEAVPMLSKTNRQGAR